MSGTNSPTKPSPIKLVSSSNFVTAVRVKAPEFSESSASGWFHILEAQFNLSHITCSSTKFFHALAALPASIVSRLSPDLLSNQDYEELKKSVLAQVEASKPELFESLVQAYTLTGRPSTYLSQLTQTAKKVGLGDEFVRFKFLQALPPNVSPVLAAQATLSLSQMGTLADELVTLVSASNAPKIQHVEQTSSRPRQEPSFAASKYVDRNLTPYHANQRSKICRTHIFFGRDARTCRPWCQWPEKSSCQVQPTSRPNSPARNMSPRRAPHSASQENYQGTQ